jgi:hypothetical protein
MALAATRRSHHADKSAGQLNHGPRKFNSTARTRHTRASRALRIKRGAAHIKSGWKKPQLLRWPRHWITHKPRILGHKKNLAW